MSRLMSVALTEHQVRDRSKVVTRRLGWKNAKPGEQLTLCRKVMGRRRKDGTVEPLVRIAEVEVVSVRRERLDAITADDVVLEGFPGWTPAEFVAFFCQAMKVAPDVEVTRLEFRYLSAQFDDRMLANLAEAARLCDPMPDALVERVGAALRQKGHDDG